MARFMLTAWDHDVEGVHDDAAEIMVLATQMFLKNIISAVVAQCKSYKSKRDFKYRYGAGAPSIWHSSTRPRNVLGGEESDEEEHAAGMEMACRYVYS